MNVHCLLSTFELELLLDSHCNSHTSVMECDACRAKSVRLTKLFKTHKPEGVVIQSPKLFKLLFPHQPDEVLLTHVLYAYFCAIEYSTWLFGQEQLSAVNEATSYRKDVHMRWLDEANTDHMMCFAMEAVLCHRIAALNIHASGQALDKERIEIESLNLTSKVCSKSFAVANTAPTKQAKEYLKFYLTINNA